VSDTPIHARYQYTAAEFVSANRWVLKSKVRPKMQVVGRIVAVALACFGAWYLYNDATFFLGYFLVTVGLFWLSLPLVARLLLHRAINRDPEKDSWIEWRIDGEGTRVNVAGVEKTSAAWSAYTQALVTHEGFLLYRGQERLSWLPFKAFASQDDQDAFQALIERQIEDIRRVV
jgi:hypothetical protein